MLTQDDITEFFDEFADPAALSGTTITYTRGAFSVVINAIRGPGDIDYGDMEGISVKTGLVTFRVKKSDLVLDSQSIDPELEDTIADGANVYDVVRHDPDETEITTRISTMKVT